LDVFVIVFVSVAVVTDPFVISVTCFQFGVASVIMSLSNR